MRAFSIRPLVAGDVERFRSIRLEALKRVPDAYASTFEQVKDKPPTYFSQILESNTVLGAFDAHAELIGIVGLARSESASLRHIVTLFGMYVRPHARGTGAAKALLREALRAAWPASIVKLAVNAGNQAAQNLYRSCGFVEWARDEQALYIDGVFHDELLMRLKLDDGS